MGEVNRCKCISLTSITAQLSPDQHSGTTRKLRLPLTLFMRENKKLQLTCCSVVLEENSTDSTPGLGQGQQL